MTKRVISTHIKSNCLHFTSNSFKKKNFHFSKE